jgi:serine/threonine protein kinase
LISEYRNNPGKLILRKIESLTRLQREMPQIEKINRISQFYEEMKRIDAKIERRGISLFIDSISMDMAADLASTVRIPADLLFWKIKLSIPYSIGKELMEKYALKTKHGIVFKLVSPLRENVIKHYCKQICDGKIDLEFPKHFLKAGE